MYMADPDPERGENVHVLMPINYLGNIGNIAKQLINIVVKLFKVFKVKKRDSTPKKTTKLL